MDASLILDATIAVLLVATIAYAVVLNRKLGALRDAKGEMEGLVARFAESTDKAGSGIESLREEAKRSGETLQGKLDAARGLADDLGFLIEKGSGLAERLDGALGVARAKAAAGGASGPTQGGRGRAQGASAGPGGTEVKPAGSAGGSGEGTRALAPGDGPAPASDAKDLSAAESELLKALQGMR
jgi:hypothetical protein